MKKYEINWYKGSISGYQSKEDIYRTIIVEGEDIKKVNPLKVLPDDFAKELEAKSYLRTILYSNERITCDYGSYTNFIEVKEIKE